MNKKIDKFTFKRSSLNVSLQNVISDGDGFWYSNIESAYPEITGYTLYSRTDKDWTQFIFSKDCKLRWPTPEKTFNGNVLRSRLESSFENYIKQISIIEDSKGLRYAIMNTPADAIFICRIVDNVIKSAKNMQISINVGQ